MEFVTALQGGVDEQKPSLFEILSEQQLISLIPPSLRYLLAIATHRNPRYLLRILNSFDEWYALLALVVERYYLKVYGGGFTENFMASKRAESDVWKNLAIIVGLPYLKRKLDEAYEIHAAASSLLGPAYQNREGYPADATPRQRIFWWYNEFLREAYPSVNAVYYFSMLAFNLAYLFDGSKYNSPWLWLIGTRIRRLNGADNAAFEAAAAASKGSTPGARPGQGNSIFNPRVMMRSIVPGALSSLRILLPASVLALQFLEWWHNSDFARQLTRKATQGLELPPPIIPGQREAKEDAEKVAEPKAIGSSPPISATTHFPILTVAAPVHATADEANTTGLCPICLSEIQTPTVSQTGYVYCYACIHKWVDGVHEKQEAFMEGKSVEGLVANGWGADTGRRQGRWENGAGRDAVTGRRLLAGTSGLRRVMI
ncbi:hypothetical protein AMS68_004851 [Peltaster fructicola]|uniref:Peroxisome assembly protein 12 n=1 Tax=Peltaster fructicola TaxID=286661 RepID=A0A6H0XX75_9PEZI|nr:hypothetical protein AMS68_004851 [Peltaster fructicola]